MVLLLLAAVQEASSSSSVEETDTLATGITSGLETDTLRRTTLLPANTTRMRVIAYVPCVPRNQHCQMNKTARVQVSNDLVGNRKLKLRERKSLERKLGKRTRELPPRRIKRMTCR